MTHSVDHPTASSTEAKIVRDLPAVAERVMIVGLDGATWDVLNPMMDSGRMPNLKAFVERGTSGILDSTRPPVTPAAWTTFMTGKSPGTHGIIDFERYDTASNRLQFNSHRSVAHVRTIWEIAGDKGLRVGVIGVPMTYPPRAVNGFMISGFETPSVRAEFTYPPELKAEVLRRWPDYTFKTTWKRSATGADEVFHENLRKICHSFHQGAEVTLQFGEEHGWDVLMVVYKLVDNLQHKTWKYLDPRFNAKHLDRAEAVANCYKELDDALGRLFAYADERNATVLIVSDHGHGSLEGKAQANLLLKKWGYLHLDSAATRAFKRIELIGSRMMRKHKSLAEKQRQIRDEIAVDFDRTRACVMHAGEYGHLYLNLKGRQPCGIVDPADYERLRDEIREKFLSVEVRHPRQGKIRLFPEVYKPEEVYDCTRDGRDFLPDLYLRVADGLSVARKIRGSGPVVWLPWRKLEGTHRPEGVFAAAGPGVARNRKARAAIIDSTPTVLAMLGLHIPDDIEGRVISELFETRIETGREAALQQDASPDSTAVFDEDEEALLAERLADLGYLD